MRPPVNKPIKVLGIGRMEKRIDQVLADRFDIYREGEAGLDPVLDAHGEEIAAIITRGGVRTDAALIARLPKLELIANYGVGYDSVDVAAAASYGVVVTNTPDVLNDEMADFAVGLLLATVRRLPQAHGHVRSGRWAKGESFPLSTSLRGRTIGIAGTGRIGKVIARRLEGFDVPVSTYGRRPHPDPCYPFYPNLRDLAQAVDTLIVVLPGGAPTSKLVDAQVLEALGPNGILINVSRGSVVDEAALIEALQSGKILGAGLDVFENEPCVPEALMRMEQVVLLPHIGTATHHTRGLMAQLVIDNMRAWFDGKGPLTPVAETPVNLQRYRNRTG
jgi:lactate dehydrogenase-like 2-hydroxyacid dehydrogenase